MENYTDVLINLKDIKISNLRSEKGKTNPQLRVNWKGSKRDFSSTELKNTENPSWDHFEEIVMPEMTIRVKKK